MASEWAVVVKTKLCESGEIELRILVLSQDMSCCVQARRWWFSIMRLGCRDVAPGPD